MDNQNKSTITVCYGQLTKKLANKEIVKGTTFQEFKVANNLNNNARVNGELAKDNYELKDKDIITQIEQIRGGLPREITLEALMKSKIFVKENSAVSFKHPKEYTEEFLKYGISGEGKDLVDHYRVVVNDPVVNEEVSGARNIAYPRAMIECNFKPFESLPDFFPVVGIVYALDIQKPVIKTYSGYNLKGCINLTIFNTDSLYQVDLLGDYQNVFVHAKKYFKEKTKESVEFSKTLTKLQSTFLDQAELDYYTGLILRKSMKTRLGTTSILGAVKTLYDPSSIYSVYQGSNFNCNKFNLLNAITQQITDGSDIVDRAKKTIELSKILLNE